MIHGTVTGIALIKKPFSVRWQAFICHGIELNSFQSAAVTSLSYHGLVDTDWRNNQISRLIGNVLSWQDIANKNKSFIYLFTNLFFVIKLPELYLLTEYVELTCHPPFSVPLTQLVPVLQFELGYVCEWMQKQGSLIWAQWVSLFLASVGGWIYSSQNTATSYGYLVTIVIIGKVTMTQRPGIVCNIFVYKDLRPLLLTCAKAMPIGS